MATDTVPAAAPGSPEPTASTQPETGFLASMLAPVEPARPTFDLSPATNNSSATAGPDEALDRSAPGLSSASFRDTEKAVTRDATGEKRKAQGSVWKAWWLAGATRWAKGGGAANKRIDMRKAKAQAHQVKESRTTSVTNSGGLSGRNSVGAGGASKGNSGKAGGNSSTKSPSNSSRGAGGGRGTSGGSGGAGSGPGSGRDKKADNRGTGSGPNGSASKGKGAAGTSGSSNTGTSAKSSGDKAKSDGKGSSPKGSGSTGTGPKGAVSGGGGKPGSAGKDGKPGKSGVSGGGNSPGKRPDTRTPLEKSREIGHKDGGAVRNAVDHVKAYKDGTVDGYRDKRDKNAREHDRLDKAHADHNKKPDDRKNPAAEKTGSPQPVIVTEQEDDGVTTDVKPLTVKSIDANALTLGADATRATYGRRELRNFKQYERKLEAKETNLQKIAEACKQLEKEAEREAKDCQDLLEQAKSVEGGEKLLGKLTKLADAAKNQTAEAAELAKCAKRAAEMCKVVLTNIQTRYAPLYKAVQDSDETKPAELRFYNDKGSYAPAA